MTPTEIKKQKSELRRKLRELEAQERKLYPRPNIYDAEGKRYKRKAPNARAIYVFDKIKRDYTYSESYGFTITTVRLVNEKTQRGVWMIDSEFIYDFVEIR